MIDERNENRNLSLEQLLNGDKLISLEGQNGLVLAEGDNVVGAESYKDIFPVVKSGEVEIGQNQEDAGGYQEDLLLNEDSVVEGKDAYKDKFPIVDEDEQSKEKVLAETDNRMDYYHYLIELPLYAGDYYYGKHINATVASQELNEMPILRPGDRISIITDGYLSFDQSKGYIKPYGDFYYASGVCWSTSALGAVMDEANKDFLIKYDIPLFVFQAGDRRPHPHSYQTYNVSNYGKGYTVAKTGEWVGDYSFTVNPDLLELEKFAKLRIQIVLISVNDHPDAYLGQSIGAYINSSVKF